MKSITYKTFSGLFFPLILFAVFVYNDAAAQNAVNSTETRKDWYGAGWFFGVVIILILVVLFTVIFPWKKRQMRRGPKYFWKNEEK